MDYKELIVRITKCRANCEILRDLETCNDAIKAIETLLEERDAAKEQVQNLQAQLDMYGGDIGITVAFQKAEERDAAVDKLHGKCVECKYGAKYPWEPPCHRCTFSGNNNCCNDYWQWRGPQKGDATILEATPTVEAAPVLHGRWIMDGKDHCHCSQCGDGRNIKTQIGWHYCPNCGAKMDLPEKEDAQ